MSKLLSLPTPPNHQQQQQERKEEWLDLRMRSRY
ncbi:hypothetical protein CsSME_00017658 [Camellia sinensis var. sinensis]